MTAVLPALRHLVIVTSIYVAADEAPPNKGPETFRQSGCYEGLGRGRGGGRGAHCGRSL